MWTDCIYISTQFWHSSFLPLQGVQCVFFPRGCYLIVHGDLAVSGCHYDWLNKDNSQTQKSRWCTVNSSANLMLNDDYTILPIRDLTLSQIFPLLNIFKCHRWQLVLFLVMLLVCSSSGSQHPSQSENVSGYKSFYTDRIVIYEEVICVLHVSIAVNVFTIFSVKN